jgi:hypothetical protein
MPRKDDQAYRDAGFVKVSDLYDSDEHVVHFGGGNPRDWAPQPGKLPSTGTLQYVMSFCGGDEDEAAAILDHVFPDAVDLIQLRGGPTITSKDDDARD